jgi:hypothetical protein
MSAFGSVLNEVKYRAEGDISHDNPGLKTRRRIVGHIHQSSGAGRGGRW